MTNTRSYELKTRTSCDGENHVYNTDHFDSKYIRQLERDPHLQTTIRGGLNAKHVDEHARIIQEPTQPMIPTDFHDSLLS